MTMQVVTLLLLWLLQAAASRGRPHALHASRFPLRGPPMHPLNWVIVVGWLTYVVIDGIRRSKGTKDIEGYFLANRSLPWWAVGCR